MKDDIFVWHFLYLILSKRPRSDCVVLCKGDIDAFSLLSAGWIPKPAHAEVLSSVHRVCSWHTPQPIGFAHCLTWHELVESSLHSSVLSPPPCCQWVLPLRNWHSAVFGRKWKWQPRMWHLHMVSTDALREVRRAPQVELGAWCLAAVWLQLSVRWGKLQSDSWRRVWGPMEHYDGYFWTRPCSSVQACATVASHSARCSQCWDGAPGQEIASPHDDTQIPMTVLLSRNV